MKTRLSFLSASALILGLAFLGTQGCGDDSGNGGTGGTGGTPADGGGGEVGTPDSGGTPDTGGTPDATGTPDVQMAAVSYNKDIKAIFAAKCSTCHTTDGLGVHNMGSSYADTQLDSYFCSGKKKGACSIVRIKSGDMPSGKGCSGDPAQDSGKSACLTAAEQKKIEDWIAAGMPEN